jgi:carbonic anhydrase/acetyltransferase-like protein (isoleucine patch superfamily)
MINSMFVDLLAAGMALIAPAFGRDSVSSAARVRARLLSKTFGTKSLWIGQNVQFVNPKQIKLERDVTLFGNAYLNAGGDKGCIEIGQLTHIDQFCVLYGQGGLRIGSRCAIASGVIVYSQTNQYTFSPQANIIDQPVVYARVTIGDDVWIGAGAIILPGVSIGSHAVIAAGTVVRSDVDEWAIMAGVPARVVGNRRSGKDKTQHQ